MSINLVIRTLILSVLLAVAAAGQNVQGNSNPNNFAAQDGFGLPYTVFAANNQANGMELWVLPYVNSTSCSGSQAPCMIEIRPGPAGSNPRNFVRLGGVYLFAADNGINGIELWRTDGTPAGTMMVADINGTGPSNPHDLTVVGNRVFFSAIDSTGDRELYVSNGVSASRVADIWSTGSSTPRALFAFGNDLLFTAEDGQHGRELWRSDGVGTTSLVADVNPGVQGSDAREITAVNGRVVFVAFSAAIGTEVWSTDGTSQGTTLLKDIEPGIAGSLPEGLTAASKVFFAASTALHGRELWATDGTASGTTMVTDLRPGPLGSDPRDIETYLLDVWFVADDGLAGREVWRTDPLGSAPVRITDVIPGPGSISPRDLVATPQPNGVAFTDESAANRLWVTSAAPGGATQIGSFQSGPGNLIRNISVTSLISGAPLVFTAADGANGLELWRSNGTAPGTSMISDIAPPGISSVIPEIELETRPDGSAVEIGIESPQQANDIALIVVGNATVPGVSLPGLIEGTLNLSAPIIVDARLLSATGSTSLVIPIPANQTPFLIAVQAFTLETTPSLQLPLIATDTGSIALATSHPPIPCGGTVEVVGTFVDKDHRYEVAVEVTSPLTEGYFQFRHRLKGGEILDLDRKTYPNQGQSFFFFSGHTPLQSIDFLELLYVCPGGQSTVVWQSYC